MPGWGVQGGERSQPFVLSYSQLFFTCASFQNNKREFNFNALSGKKKKHLQYSQTEIGTITSAVQHIYTHLCMKHINTDRGNRVMISTKAHTEAKLF